jgi:hypothetical protein
MDFSKAKSEEDFNKAHTKAFINEIQHLLSPEEASLISLNDVKQMIKSNAETYIGMKVIPIEKIVGSEGRYKDFDNRFFPKSTHLKTAGSMSMKQPLMTLPFHLSRFMKLQAFILSAMEITVFLLQKPAEPNL